MDSAASPPSEKTELQSPRCRLPDSRALHGDARAAPSSSDPKAARHLRWPLPCGRGLQIPPWLGWLLIYAFVQFYFSFSRCLALQALVSMYGTSADYTTGTKLTALSLGFLEDFVCTTYFVTALWIFDTSKHVVMEHYGDHRGMHVVEKLATFFVSWLLFFGIVAPFVADMMLVVHRDMRFSFSLLVSVLRERDFLKDAPISSEEVQAANMTGCYVVLIATLFALVRVGAQWTNLAHWNPSRLVLASNKTGTRGILYQALALEEGARGARGTGTFDKLKAHLPSVPLTPHRVKQVVVVVMGLVVIPALVVAIRAMCSPLVAYAALNVPLNELLLHKLEPSVASVDNSMLFGGRPWFERIVDSAEEYQRYGENTLFRRTTGFHGDLAFNVSIDHDNPPNVLVIGIESFRYRDSRYLVGQEDPSKLFKGTNLTICPNFDRWARRGVAFRNIWSSIPTSRSLESLIYGQVPYQSSSKTGITGGSENVELSGLPQLFLKKGYETYFTTGSSITFDSWDLFLPSHGYNTVWNRKSMMKIAEKTLNISRDDWSGREKRAGNWGVHDDVSFQILGNLLIEKKQAQEARVAKGEKKGPTFVTHYTISSHEPYHVIPRWYEQSPKPDFSAMYQGEEYADQIKRYMNVRYFTDVELGKFLDRMEREGVLNDTIVVIAGDHGQAPEVKRWNQDEVSSTRVPAVILAEGRLGRHAGLIIDDAAEHYDFLNTLADITGLPHGGFVQTGVGRSLKRKLPFGRRVVFTNDPLRKMAIVKGHKRLRYDLVADAMTVHDTELDYHVTTDLLPLMSKKERAGWEALREEGRRIATYFLKRWDENCLLAVKCNDG